MIQANFDNRPIVPPDEYAENYCRNTIEALKRKRKVYCSHKSLQTKKQKTKPTNRKAFAWVRWNEWSSTWAMGAIQTTLKLSSALTHIHTHLSAHTHTYINNATHKANNSTRLNQSHGNFMLSLQKWMKKKENCNDSKVENTLYEYLWKILSVEWKASQSLSLMNERMEKNTKFFLWFLIFSCLLLRVMRLLHCVCDGYMSYLRRLQ